jgi:hypothetical protein
MRFSSERMRQDRGMTDGYRMLVLKIHRINYSWNVRGKEILPYSFWETNFLKIKLPSREYIICFLTNFYEINCRLYRMRQLYRH